MQFRAEHLPPGLSLDVNTGIITGTIRSAGEYRLTVRARNAKGSASRVLMLVAGGKLALTPPMGWSSWYMAYDHISDQLIRAQAKAMITTGLVNHGYSYVDIDDGWNRKPRGGNPRAGDGARTPAGKMMTNDSFPDMQALTRDLHRMGLKAGIYTSPGPTTCGGYEGSYGHEAQDAHTFAEWGFDLLKYDMCSYMKLLRDKKDTKEVQKPYRLMGSILPTLGRDILFNLCQYGLGDVWTWGAETGGNFWRTSGDVGDSARPLWQNVVRIGFGQAGKEKWAGPGGWNDPDNLLLGQIYSKDHLAPAPLTHNQQYTYVTLWSLLAAPLVFGGDVTKLDDFTLSLLINDEVIAIDQDALGKQGAPVRRSAEAEVWVKDLDDQSKAVGLFNHAGKEATLTAQWSDLGIDGTWTARDAWRQQDLGSLQGSVSMSVGEQGAALILLKRKTP